MKIKWKEMIHLIIILIMKIKMSNFSIFSELKMPNEEKVDVCIRQKNIDVSDNLIRNV